MKDPRLSHLDRLIEMEWSTLRMTNEVLSRLNEANGISAGDCWVLDSKIFPAAHWTALWKVAEDDNVHALLRKAFSRCANLCLEASNIEQEIAELEENNG